jgi:death-on-curing protein
VPGVLNVGGIESAIGRPYNGYYPRIWSKAAALAESLVRNHGYVDGNKRTAFIVVMMFLDRSGWSLDVGATQEAVEDLMVKIADRQLTFVEIEAWFRKHCVGPAQLEAIYRSTFGDDG